MTKYTVLFVDDEPNILRALVRLFHGDHINILTASSGDEALEIMRNKKVQVLVTDNLMPGMQGVELVRRARDIFPDMIRIILSGHSDLEAVLKAVNESEVFRFVLKPWTDADLKATVHIALAQYGLQEDIDRLKSDLAEKDRLIRYLTNRHPDLFKSLPDHPEYEIESGASTATAEAITEGKS
ncbi:MAG: response regulator [Candidatus Zixiibacteriota bacterium]